MIPQNRHKDKYKHIKKIIYLAIQHLDSRNFERFGIKLFQESGFAVEYWDVTPVIYADAFYNYALPTKSVNFEGIRTFREAGKLYKQLADLRSDTLVIDLMSFNHKFKAFYKVLSRSKANYALIAANTYPDINDINTPAANASRRLKKLFTPNLPGLWRDSILPKLPATLFGIRPASLVMIGGERALKKYPHYPIGRNTEVILAHSFDYDLYLKEPKQAPVPARPSAVYLDSYFPFQREWQMYFGFRAEDKMDIKRYYELLNNFFAQVEKEYKVEVVIAAHPRSDYKIRPDCFMGRKCVKGETIKLVRESKVVLSQDSLSVGYANLFNKPIIFFNQPTPILPEVFASVISATAQLHGKKMHYIDNGAYSIDWQTELEVSRGHYENYRRLFLKTPGSPDIPFWQIFINALRREQ